ncbi:MAG: PCRF domain-containing protein, partial [Actinomycetota bacterium]
MRDFSDEIKDVSRRLDEARVYLKIDSRRERFRELEVEIARPDLWDDQNLAKKLNAEYAVIKDDLDLYGSLTRELEDVEVLHEMAREVDDASQEGDIESGLAKLTTAIRALELRSLFTGEHDEADCIVHINTKDGG